MVIPIKPKDCEPPRDEEFDTLCETINSQLKQHIRFFPIDSSEGPGTCVPNRYVNTIKQLYGSYWKVSATTRAGRNSAAWDRYEVKGLQFSPLVS